MESEFLWLKRMYAAKKLSEVEVQEGLKKRRMELSEWKLHREFQCKDFVAAFGNMTQWRWWRKR